jgi:hypothetical protein
MASVPSDERAEKIGRLFSAFAKQIQDLILEALGLMQTDRVIELEAMQAVIDALVESFITQVNPLAGEVIAAAYADSSEMTIESLERIGPAQTTQIVFGGPADARVIELLMQNATTRLDAAAVSIGRRAQDALREISLQQLTLSSLKGESVRDASKRLERELDDRGLISDDGTSRLVRVLGKDGKERNYQAGKYAQVVVRTTGREAASVATAQRMLEAEVDLVTISEHDHAPDECSAYAGKTFSLTGATKGYPVLDQFPPFHPNCVHVMTPAAIF